MITLYYSVSNEVLYVNVNAIARIKNHYNVVSDRNEGADVYFMNGDIIVVKETPHEILLLIEGVSNK